MKVLMQICFSSAALLTFFNFASATTCRALLEHGLDPRPYVSHVKLSSDGRGQLAPPIGSKVFIAWRSRTPPHIPDTAYYVWWIKEADVLRLSLEAGEAAEAQPVKLETTSIDGALYYVPSGTSLMPNYLKKTFDQGKERSGELLLNERALTFFDEEGAPVVFILDKNKNHNMAAKQILRANPELSFYSADNLSLRVFFGSSHKIQKIILLRPYDTSPHLSAEVLQRAAPLEVRKNFDESVFVRDLFLSSVSEQLESPLIFEKESAPSAPVRPRPLHMLK